MSLAPPMLISLPRRSATDLIAGFAQSEYGGTWVSTRKSEIGAPLSIARSGSVSPPEPILAEPAASCCMAAAVEEAATRSSVTPCCAM